MPETDPCWTTQDSKAQPLSTPRSGLRSAEICGNFQQNAEIVGNVFLTSWTLKFKHCKTRGAKNAGNLSANFLQTPEVQSALQTPPPSALDSRRFGTLQFGIFSPCGPLSHQPN